LFATIVLRAPIPASSPLHASLLTRSLLTESAVYPATEALTVSASRPPQIASTTSSLARS
jgi:hypothetical protein